MLHIRDDETTYSRGECMKRDGKEDFQDDVSMNLDLGPPSQDLLDYARKNLGEYADTRAAIAQELRDMIYERGEVEPHRTDDAFLVRFLRTRRFHVERAHKLMVNYYSFKKNNPELHEDVDPLELNFIGEDDVVNVLPYRDQNGRRILVYKVGNWNPSDYSVEELLKATVVVMELAILEQRAQILGGVCLIDMSGVSLQHVWNITPSVAQRVIELLVTSFPIRTHAIHIVFQPWVFDMMFAIFRPLLDDRMKEKIYFHGDDMESLHAHIDQKFLPEKYGGTRREYSYLDWMDSLKMNPTVVKELELVGYKLTYVLEEKD